MTLDTGVLIAFERRDRAVFAHLKEAQNRGYDLTVPTVVIAEAWRGGSRSVGIAKLLTACSIEPLGERMARTAGEALARVAGSTVIDAIVMASAAARGDRVLTSDPEDLRRLQVFFAGVRVEPL